ncbi:ligase-associated DNA damage response exonuclease [Caldimonas manganoxidans]|uniref:ligase-associated DNA damage response exonuclease n=1 Tax=Caldimonas manganoxidans TaxID=196015 RepID=UPI000363B3BC|nr:ligase-associated DNA damage response exonuclease [Caldimonas manganoxidans]
MGECTDLVVWRPQGLYCPAGDFYIDPWRPVQRAVLTHAHADHARAGHQHYLAAAPGAGVLRERLGDISLQTLAYSEVLRIGAVSVSLHPAGHVLGSAQVRLEHRGEVWVVSGDYKLDADGTCAPFEPVRCHCFITESTFGLPIYRWPSPARVLDEIRSWWAANAAEGRPSLLYAYSLGKAQRLLHGLREGPGPLVVHPSVAAVNRAYVAAGVCLPPTLTLGPDLTAETLARALVIAPPAASRSGWAHRLGDARDGCASGWMLLRGTRRRQGVDRGFPLSDHADWPALLQAIGDSGAARVIVTHGYEAAMVRWLQERGWEAGALRTEYGDEG